MWQFVFFACLQPDAKDAPVQVRPEVARLESIDAKDRVQAAQFLIENGVQATEWSLVLRRLRSSDQETRRTLCKVVGAHGNGRDFAYEALKQTLKLERNEFYRGDIFSNLASFGPSRVDDLMGLFASSKEKDKQWIVDRIGSMSAGTKKENRNLLERVAAVFDSESEDCKCIAQESLHRFAKSAGEPLHFLLDTKNVDREIHVAGAVLALDPKDADAVRRLVRRVEQSKDRQQEVAASMLFDAVIADDAHLKPLTDALSCPNPKVHLWICGCIGTLKEKARPATDALGKLLDEPETRMHAADALGKIGGAKSVKLLAPYLGDNDEEMRERAVRALGWIGADAKETLPTIRRLIGQGLVPEDTAAEAIRAIDRKE
jgi:hypothetical protein